jgi:hydrogenase maturation protease
VNALVAVFGIGNRSRGDDAAGPVLLDRLREWVAARELDGRFALFEEYQLQVENALDLEGRSLALFLDASRHDGPGVAFRRLEAPPGPGSCHTHELDPAEVLAVYRLVTGKRPPPAYALGIRGEGFGLGDEIHPATRQAMDEAWRLLEELARDPRPETWQSAARARSREEDPWLPARPRPAPKPPR